MAPFSIVSRFEKCQKKEIRIAIEIFANIYAVQLYLNRRMKLYLLYPQLAVFLSCSGCVRWSRPALLHIATPSLPPYVHTPTPACCHALPLFCLPVCSQMECACVCAVMCLWVHLRACARVCLYGVPTLRFDGFVGCGFVSIWALTSGALLVSFGGLPPHRPC